MSSDFINYDELNAKSNQEPQTEPANTEPAQSAFLPPEAFAQPETPSNAAGAALGAGAAALAKYKGVSLNPANVLKPAAKTFSPHADAVNQFNMVMRAKTGDPTFDVTSMSADQVRRVLQGGEGDTLGTTGRQREESYNLETARRARMQKSMESFVQKNFPKTPDPLVSMNEPYVALPSNIQVPASEATKQAQDLQQKKLQAQAEAYKKLKQSGVSSGISNIGRAGIAGGLAETEAQKMATQQEPIDYTQYLSQLGNVGLYNAEEAGPYMPLALAISLGLKAPYLIKHGSKEIENLKKLYPQTSNAIQQVLTPKQTGALPTEDQYDYSGYAP